MEQLNTQPVIQCNP